VIDNVSIFGNAYARDITGNSRICGDAFYQIINSFSFSFLNNPGSPCPSPFSPGNGFAGSSNKSVLAMAIPDSFLDEWEGTAVAGGVINFPCPYQIVSGTTTLGPIKINCDLEVSGNATEVILTGAVWVNGDFVVNGNPKFKVSNSIGNKSVPIIAHTASNPTQGGAITLSNTPLFFGSEVDGVPNPDSYVMFVSRNTGAEAGTGDKAIIAGNNITGNLLLYAPHGEIVLSNNAFLRSVNAHLITLRNNVQVEYSPNLSGPLLVPGTTGIWIIRKWREI
jgi:hypothetical protein